MSKIAIPSAPNSSSWPKNVLRTLAYVAAHGSVGRTELGEWQRSLPSADWGPFALADGWQPVKQVLSWATVQLTRSRTVTVRALVGLLLRESLKRASREERRIVEDLGYLLASRPGEPEFDQHVTVPETEIGVRLGRKRGQTTREAYDAALRFIAGAAERRNLDDHIDLRAAEQRLRDTQKSLNPIVLYEAVRDREVVVRAILEAHRAGRLSEEQYALVFAIHDGRLHRLYIESRRRLTELSRVLDIPARRIQKAAISRGSIETRPWPQAESDLLQAARQN